MIEQARRQLKEEGFAGDKVKLEWSIDLRYSRQVHEVTTMVRGRTPLDEAALTQLVSDFEAQYERKYGKGSAFREAGIEMTMFRLTARGLIDRPRLEPLPLAGTDAIACQDRTPPDLRRRQERHGGSRHLRFRANSRPATWFTDRPLSIPRSPPSCCRQANAAPWMDIETC